MVSWASMYPDVLAEAEVEVEVEGGVEVLLLLVESF